MSEPESAVICFFKHEAGKSSRIPLIYIQTVFYILFTRKYDGSKYN
jgi:hypothetical protein